MAMPWSRAASNTVVPFGTVTACPSIVRCRSLIQRSCDFPHRTHTLRTAMLQNVGFHFRPEMFDHRRDGRVRELAQATDGGELHGFRKFLEQSQVRNSPFTLRPARENVG